MVMFFNQKFQKGFLRNLFFLNFIIKLYKLHWITFQISVWVSIGHNIELSVKYTTSISFVQVGVVLDGDSIQIYEGCRYGFIPLNSAEDRSEWTFEEKIVDYGYELHCTGLFLVF